MKLSKPMNIVNQFLLIVTIFGVTLTIKAADIDVNATQEGIEKLKSLHQKIPPLVKQVNAINFGPFNFKGSCGYDSHWYCFGNCMTENWTYKPDFGSGKTVVVNAYQGLGSTANTFSNYFEPTKNWMLTQLPQISDAFEKASVAVAADIKVYNDPNSTPAQKSQAEASVIVVLNTLVEKLNNGKANLSPAVSGIATFNKSLNQAFSSLSGAQSYIDRMFSAAEKSVTNSNLKCGKKDCMNNLKAAEAVMRAQLTAVDVVSTTMGVDAKQLDNAISLILGSLVSVQQQIIGVVQNLKDAKITPAGAVQQLRLTVAQKNWQKLADYAKSRL
jgi:hypothetical protein